MNLICAYRLFILNSIVHVLCLLVFSSTVFANNTSIHSDKTIKLPFRYVQSFIILDVQLEKLVPIKLIFDTGAEHTILFEKIWTDIIAGSYVREIKVIGSDLQQEIPAILTSPLKLRFGGKHEFVSPMIVLKENVTNISQVIGESIQGILSAAIFSQYLIEIDFKHQLLILRSKDYEIPTSFKPIDIEIYKNKPYIQTKVSSKNGSNQIMNLLLDTGAGLSLLMYSDSASLVNMPDKIIPGYLGSGLGGMLTGFVGKIQYMSLDTFLVPGVITHFLKIHTQIGRNESQHKNGLIGNQILDRFTIILDYQKEILYLKPINNYQEVLDYDKSGMLVISGGGNLQSYYVAYIVPNTPASEAGIHENDQILKINGWPVTFYSLAKINSILQGKAGKKINLKVKRDGKKMKFSFVLRPLI